AGEQSSIWSEIGGIRVRIGIHTGEPTFRDNDYFGPAVNRAARISSAAHGGMVLLSQETARLAASELDADFALLDQDLHRLKDLGEPERLFLLQHPKIPRRPFAALRTLDALPHNFPAQVNSFVGRVRELKELSYVLARSDRRLITVTGPGGSGKTRLALQVAADHLQHFPGGAWFVELAPVSDHRAVPTAVALALSLSL